jgi:cytochrome P450
VSGPASVNTLRRRRSPYCLGASLARTQLRSIFGELLTRLPDIEVGEPDKLAGTFIRGVKRMECSFAPRGA